MALDAAIVGVTAEWLVSSIDGLVETHPQLSREWVGLILLPIVSFLLDLLTYKSEADK
jgi:Ca2+:H+ antiporter